MSLTALASSASSPSSSPHHRDALWQMNMSTLEQMESGAYPVRDGVQDCSYYLRTGLCRFGATCRFNHPLYRRLAFATAIIKCGYPERIGEPECQFYLKTGTCKFGVTCKFHHPRDRAGIAERASLNVLGYPLRPGQVVPVSPLENLQKTAGNSQNDGMLHQGEGIYRGAQFDLNSLHYAFQRDDVFPQRPGQPECQFYMKTGDCKFGALCKFHHPREKFVPVPDCVLSPLGFPLRPGEPHCVFYSRYGVCKFGPSCKFDHPMRVFAYNGAAASSSTSASVVCNFVDSLPGARGLSLSSDEVVEAGDKPSDDYLFDTE